MNELKRQYIIDLQQIEPNIFTFKNHQVNRFYEHGAKELNLRYIQDDIKHRFYYKKSLIGGVNGLKPVSTSKSAFIICKDKIKTERLLSENSIPALNSGFFLSSEKDQAREFIIKKELKNFVIKPLSLASGKGIQFDVNLNSFDTAWDRSIKIQFEHGVKDPSCMIQRYIDGFDIRVAITEGVYSSALLKIPAYIIGDGESTIEQLIEVKNEMRKKSIYFKRFLYVIDEELVNKLSIQDLNLDSILEKDRIVFISELGNLSAGAESIDITDSISKNLIDIALRATAAIPGLHTSGVDILTNDFTSDEGFVSEVNTNANHQVHHLPFRGAIRKPFRDIIQVMFVRYKLEKGIPLNSEERMKSVELLKFLKYKEFYHNNTYRLYMKDFL